MLSDVVAAALLGVLALGVALLLRERAPWSWPRSLIVLLPLAVVGAALVVRTAAATYLWRGVGPGERWLPVALVVVVVVVLAIGRSRGASWVATSWVAGALLLIGLTTLPSGEDGPRLAADPAGQLRSCLLAQHRAPSLGIDGPRTSGLTAGGPGTEALPVFALAAHPLGVTRGTTALLPVLDVRKLTTEQLPNVALFVPLGIGVAALARRRTGWWIAVAAVVSVGVESYQAVFTSRTCSTVDVATNALGVLLGWAVLAVAVRVAVRLATRRTRPATRSTTRPTGGR